MLLLGLLPANLIPSAAASFVAPLTRSLSSVSSGSEDSQDKKHRKQDTGLGNYLKPVVEQADLTPEQLRDIVDHMPHVSRFCNFVSSFATRNTHRQRGAQICFTAAPNGQITYYNQRWLERSF